VSSPTAAQALLAALIVSMQGYDNLSTLEQPLVSDVHEQEEYERQHGVPSPGGGGYRPPAGGSAYYPPQPSGAAGYPPAPAAAGVGPRTSHGPMPSPADELQELSLLARDAAEILWEMVAMGEAGAAVEDMKNKAAQLQAQLRGAIGDYQASALATALDRRLAVACSTQHVVHSCCQPDGLCLFACASWLASLAQRVCLLVYCRAVTKPSLPGRLKALTCSVAAWRSRMRLPPARRPQQAWPRPQQPWRLRLVQQWALRQAGPRQMRRLLSALTEANAAEANAAECMGQLLLPCS
jgi:hypothetical protein